MQLTGCWSRLHQHHVRPQYWGQPCGPEGCAGEGVVSSLRFTTGCETEFSRIRKTMVGLFVMVTVHRQAQSSTAGHKSGPVRACVCVVDPGRTMGVVSLQSSPLQPSNLNANTSYQHEYRLCDSCDDRSHPLYSKVGMMSTRPIHKPSSEFAGDHAKFNRKLIRRIKKMMIAAHSIGFFVNYTKF